MSTNHLYIKETICGNQIEVMTMQHKNASNFIIKIGKDTYVDTRAPLRPYAENIWINSLSGDIYEKCEVYEYKNKIYELKKCRNNDARVCQMNTMRSTMRKIRELVNANTSEPEKCKWLTLTYADNMQDTKRLYHDIEIFIKKMRYHLEHFEYIAVIEPQGRGAWHAHIILIFQHRAPFISAKWIEALWGYGYIDIKNINDNDGIGNYLSAYLSDIELTGENADVQGEIIEKSINGQSKKFIKGARLSFYPSGMNIYRHSKGIKMPIKKDISKEEAEAIDNAYVLRYSSTKSISIEKYGYENEITYNCYNAKHKKKGG